MVPIDFSIENFEFCECLRMMINVDAVVIIMLIGRYHYVFAEATHDSQRERSRMGRKVH